MPKNLSQPMRIRAVESAGTSNIRTIERLGGAGAIESKAADDGTYDVRILVEGRGSSATYPKELIESPVTAAVMDGLKSFFDHPRYDFAPEERSVLKLAGRFVPRTVHAGVTEDGLAAVYGKFKPRAEYAEFFEEFADTLGVSIYLAASFVELADGTRKAESFLPDPYNSIDIVIAAGAGGRFEQARESLRTIEASLGNPKGDTPAVEASAEEEEGNMTKEEFQALVAEALAPLVADVAALKTAATEKATAEATAEAVAEASKSAVESYAEKVAAIDAAEDLLDSQRASLIEAAKGGADITDALASAQAIATEAKAAFSADVQEPAGFVYESGAPGAGGFTVGGWAHGN